MMEGARGDEEKVARFSGTYVEGELVVHRFLEESIFHFPSLQLETRWLLCCVRTGGMSKLSV